MKIHTETPSNTLRSTRVRILGTVAAAFIAALALLAIRMQDHSVVVHYPRYHPSMGEQMISMGTYLLPCLALLPLIVWVPRRWVPWALASWLLLFVGVGASKFL